MFRRRFNDQGITLFEILLVLAIGSAILMLGLNFYSLQIVQLQRNKVTSDINQILNAATDYYVNFGTWPGTGSLTSSSALVTAMYLGSAPVSPWSGSPYTTSATTANGVNTFSVSLITPNANEAQIIAGNFPIATTSGSTVTVSVNVPSQNLNNIHAINFAGMYNSGACVPVPTCPLGTTAQITVVPSIINGIYKSPTCSNANDPLTCTSVTISPIVNFNAFATNIATYDGSNASTGPHDCATNSTGEACSTTGTYWRVCLSITTDQGVVSPGSQAWGDSVGTVLATTRCVPSNEPYGSDFSVWVQ